MVLLVVIVNVWQGIRWICFETWQKTLLQDYYLLFPNQTCTCFCTAIIISLSRPWHICSPRRSHVGQNFIHLLFLLVNISDSHNVVILNLNNVNQSPDRVLCVNLLMFAKGLNAAFVRSGAATGHRFNAILKPWWAEIVKYIDESCFTAVH